MPSLFFSYSHRDEDLRDQLEIQLTMLKRQGVIETWHDRRIGPGQDFARQIDNHVETDDILLLLVSPDFLASDYCYDREMLRAMARHEAGEAVVIPVILRACDWTPAPFGKLLATPRDGKPVTQWPDRDQAFLEVAKAVRAAAERFKPSSSMRPPIGPAPVTGGGSGTGPRSSNLRVAKRFTQRDMDQFRIDSFEYMALFFENSVGELAARNPGIEADFRRIDAGRFVVRVYRDGARVSSCTVFMGASFGSDGIAYVAQETTASNAMNELLSVEADDQSLYLSTLGMARIARPVAQKLTQEGAAELYWGLLIEPVQRP